MEIKKLFIENISEFISIVGRSYPGMKLVSEERFTKSCRKIHKHTRKTFPIRRSPSW